MDNQELKDQIKELHTDINRLTVKLCFKMESLYDRLNKKIEDLKESNKKLKK